MDTLFGPRKTERFGHKRSRERFSILKHPCIKERVLDVTMLRESINSYIKERNQIKKRMNWHFTKDDAGSSLMSFYPDIYEFNYVA